MSSSGETQPVRCQKESAADSYQFQSPIHRHRYLLDHESHGHVDGEAATVVRTEMTSRISVADRHRLYLQQSQQMEGNGSPLPPNSSQRRNQSDDLSPAQSRKFGSSAFPDSSPKCTCDTGNQAAELGQPIIDPSAPGYQYESLGRILRSNVIHGPMVTYTNSVTHEDYNSLAFDAAKNPHGAVTEGNVKARSHKPPDKYRYRKDDLSNWAEHNIVHNRMMKALDVNKPTAQKQK